MPQPRVAPGQPIATILFVSYAGNGGIVRKESCHISGKAKDTIVNDVRLERAIPVTKWLGYKVVVQRQTVKPHVVLGCMYKGSDAL